VQSLANVLVDTRAAARGSVRARGAEPAGVGG